jgi:hypothetical protein
VNLTCARARERLFHVSNVRRRAHRAARQTQLGVSPKVAADDPLVLQKPGSRGRVSGCQAFAEEATDKPLGGLENGLFLGTNLGEKNFSQIIVNRVSSESLASPPTRGVLL